MVLFIALISLIWIDSCLDSSYTQNTVIDCNQTAAIPQHELDAIKDVMNQPMENGGSINGILHITHAVFMVFVVDRMKVNLI